MYETWSWLESVYVCLTLPVAYFEYYFNKNTESQMLIWLSDVIIAKYDPSLLKVDKGCL